VKNHKSILEMLIRDVAIRMTMMVKATILAAVKMTILGLEDLTAGENPGCGGGNPGDDCNEGNHGKNGGIMIAS
jgi:hypothetical protein